MGHFPRGKEAGGADHPPRINTGRATPVPPLCASLARKGAAFILRTSPIGVRVLFVIRVLGERLLLCGSYVEGKGAGHEDKVGEGVQLHPFLTPALKGSTPALHPIPAQQKSQWAPDLVYTFQKRENPLSLNKIDPWTFQSVAQSLHKLRYPGCKKKWLSKEKYWDSTLRVPPHKLPVFNEEKLGTWLQHLFGKTLSLLAQERAVSRFKFQVASAITPSRRASELERNTFVRGVRNGSVTADRVTDICCGVSADIGRYLPSVRGVVGRLPARDCLL